MNKSAGIIRNENSMKEGIEALEEIYYNLEKNVKFQKEYIETLNMALVSLLILQAAILNKENQGAHFRDDI